MVQLSHPSMTTGKTIALTRQTCVGKVMSLLFNMLSRLVMAFLPRSRCILISWLQSLSTMILEPKKIKSGTVSIVSPSNCHEGGELIALTKLNAQIGTLIPLNIILGSQFICVLISQFLKEMNSY